MLQANKELELDREQGQSPRSFFWAPHSLGVSSVTHTSRRVGAYFEAALLCFIKHEANEVVYPFGM